jgi:subtilase family protein
MPAHPGASPDRRPGHRPLALARRLTGRRLALAAAATVTVAAVAAAPAMAAAVQALAAHPGAVSAARLDPQPACGQAAPSSASCLAIVDTGLHWTGQAWTTGPAPVTRPRTAPPDTLPAATVAAPTAAAGTVPSAPEPFMAASLQSAYKLPSSLVGSGQTIAVVDAYDNPTAAADLATYRKANHLPACTKAFPCFAKVNQEGQHGHYPLANASWAVEESLDVDMASAICPNCHIILVEANDNTLANLAAAEDEAAKLGATVISNSYGGAESAGESAIAPAYDHPGIAIIASSGDDGFGVNIPSALATVTAVGGTSLYPAAGTARGWAEGSWQGSGSGCSAYTAKPAWQHDPLCGTRTTADVSAVADPDTPVAVYDSGDGGWVAVGGTSVASPIIAGVYALAGNAATIGTGASHVYAHAKDLFDVTSGLPFASGGASNGDCGGSYLCTAGPGYDGPTGLGTPDGTGAF